jgi:parvulin-like peptidyl-prolyl isomerase
MVFGVGDQCGGNVLYRGEYSMKTLLTLLSVVLLVTACSDQKEADTVLKAGDPAYKYAVALKEKIPYLDPEQNNTLIRCKSFDVTTGEVVSYLFTQFGEQMNQLQQQPEDRIVDFVRQTASSIASKNMIVRAATQEGYEVEQSEIDSVFALYAQNFGGEEQYVEQLSKTGVAAKDVKLQINERLLGEKYLADNVEKKCSVAEEEILESYQQDKTASVRHILLTTTGKNEEEKQEIRQKMEEILKEARQGGDFAQLAKKYTEDPGSRESGGLYQDFGRGKMVKSFEDASFSVPVGKISDIVETQYGYHIIKVENRKQESRPLEEVRGELEKQLLDTKRRDVYQALIEALQEDEEYEEIDFTA